MQSLSLDMFRIVGRRVGSRMRLAVLGLAVGAVVVTGCRNDMHDQPKYKPLRKSAFFIDSLSARPPVAGTVARGHDEEADSLLYTGLAQHAEAQPIVQGDSSSAVQGTGKGKFSEVFPFPVTRTVLLRGQERFDIYCSPCHGRLGDGKGLVVQRGFQMMPPSYHIERLRKAPPGYFFDVMTHGFGGMYSYASRIKAEDRWAIAAYIRALQLSQNATASDVPAGINLDNPPPPASAEAAETKSEGEN